jgi:signal transduction histidine kinase
MHSRKLPLQRRLFWFIGLTNLLAFAVAAAVTHFLTPGLRPNIEEAPAFLSQEFAHVWQQPTERARLAHSLASTMRFRVTLRDQSGSKLEEVGGQCSNPYIQADVRSPDGERRLGSLAVCSASDQDRRAIFVLLLGLTGLTMWFGAGVLARRLSWPLVELTQVTRRLGEGDLKSRVRLALHAAGEAGALAHSINQMGARIEKQLAEQRELLGAVSHEIRSPLARLRVLTELLRDESGGSKRVEEIEREIAELDALTGKLLAKSRLDFDSLSLSEVDLVDITTLELERAGLAADLLRYDEASLVVSGDATLLARALANLLENAEHHGAGVTRVTLEPDGDLVWVRVHDRGTGFGEGEKNATRGEAKIPRAGLGLGLSLVRRIASAHGGTVRTHPDPGGGSIVEFSVRAH